MGRPQAQAYRYVLGKQYRDKDGKVAIGAKLQALRAVSAGIIFGLPEEATRLFTPRIQAGLTLIRDVIAQRGEQVLVFSALRAPNDDLAEYLRGAAVSFSLMDGRVSAKKRGEISRRFEAKEFPVLLCGLESACEGHSWPQARTA